MTEGHKPADYLSYGKYEIFLLKVGAFMCLNLTLQRLLACAVSDKISKMVGISGTVSSLV